MNDKKATAEQLDYIGGQDEDLGGYCESLVITDVNGKEHYLLHVMAQYRDSSDGDKIKAKHTKLELTGKEILVEEFKKVRDRLGIDSSLPWEETDAGCGYDFEYTNSLF